MIPLIAVVMLLIQSCGGNENADLAFRAANADMGETNVSQYANEAYAELYDLNTEDACKLTIAYYYLFLEHYTTEYGTRFGNCYEYVTYKDEAGANECFNSLAGTEAAASKIKNGYENIGLMEEAGDTFKEWLEIDPEESVELNSWPSDEIRMGAMAFLEESRKQRHFFMPETYSSLNDSQKKLLSPLGLVVYNSNIKLIVNNEDLNSSTWYKAQEAASSCHSEDTKTWRLMSLSEGRLLNRIYDDLLLWAERWNKAGVDCDMAIANAYTSTTSGEDCYTIDISDGMESLCPKDEDWMGFGRYVSSI